MTDIPDIETQRELLRKEVRRIRKNSDKAPFFALTGSSPMTRGLPKKQGGNGLYTTPASFLAEQLGLKQPKIEGVRPNQKGFASNFDKLADAYVKINHGALGTPNLDTICDILMDGCIVTNFSGPLGASEETCSVLKDTFAGAHGPLFVFLNEATMKEERKKITRAKKNNVYSAAVIHHIALPDKYCKKYVMKVLSYAVEEEFISAEEFRDVEAKVLTYDEAIDNIKPPSKKVRPKPVKLGKDFKDLVDAPAGSRHAVVLTSGKSDTKEAKKITEKKKKATEKTKKATTEEKTKKKKAPKKKGS